MTDFYAILKRGNPYHEPAGSSRGGQFSSKPGGAERVETTTGIQFVSPNVREGTDHSYAQSALGSEEQKHYEKVFEQVDRAFGNRGAHVGAIGAWSDGAENTIVQFTGGPDYSTLKACAAMKGYLAEQKAVIFFKAGEGEQKMHTFEIEKESDAKGVTDALVKMGLPYHTLIPQGTGFQVLVFDDGSDKQAAKATFKAATAAAKAFGSTHRYMKGKGEILGSWDTREEGRAKYKEVIDSYLEAHPNEKVKWDRLLSEFKPRVMKYLHVLRSRHGI